MLHLEKFCKAHHGVEWCTYLETHIMEEGILHHLHLLGTECLGCQLLFEVLDLADVTAHADVVYHLTSLVVDGDKVELQIKPVAAMGT